MKNTYNYLRTTSYLDTIEIEDIGNCIIEAYNDDGDLFYLIIRTVLGVSRILQFGPIQNGAVTECACSFKQMDYDDYKIDKLIDKFVDGKFNFSQIISTKIETKAQMQSITDTLPDIKEFLYD